jgi:hypothetical protein
MLRLGFRSLFERSGTKRPTPLRRLGEAQPDRRRLPCAPEEPLLAAPTGVQSDRAEMALPALRPAGRPRPSDASCGFRLQPPWLGRDRRRASALPRVPFGSTWFVAMSVLATINADKPRIKILKPHPLHQIGTVLVVTPDKVSVIPRPRSRIPCVAMTATWWCSASPSRKTLRLLPSASVGSSYLRVGDNTESKLARPEGRTSLVSLEANL